MDEDWFRGGAWTADDQEAFEARLSRARRSNRPQYLRIKGLGLEATGETAAARALWRRVLDDPDASWVDRVSATEHLADSLRSDSPRLAANLYRELSGMSPTLSGTSGTHHVKLALLLLDSGGGADLAEVDQLLSWWADNARDPFPSNHFAWSIARAKWALASGAGEAARDAALAALDLVDGTAPFPRHPAVGLVNADDATLDWLREVAS